MVAITPAMGEGSGLSAFERLHPERYFDVGIAEQHALTFAAGLACGGMKPVVAIYSTFLQRAYDQLIHDVQLQNLPVLFAVDRAGLAGADGATHHGAFDLSYLRCIPNITLMVPSDENECRQMLHTGYLLNSPAVVRYPRGCGPGAAVVRDQPPLPLGRAQLRRTGGRVAFLAFGTVLAAALEAAEALGASVANMRFVKPLDEAMVLHLATSHELLVTVEENVVAGGAGGAVGDCLDRLGIAVPLLKLGLPDRFVDHGTQAELLEQEGLDARGILQAVQERLARMAPGARRAPLLATPPHPLRPIA
jgi:1-deoxy-D-xylulose-5-phosphate synthase